MPGSLDISCFAWSPGTPAMIRTGGSFTGAADCISDCIAEANVTAFESAQGGEAEIGEDRLVAGTCWSGTFIRRDRLHVVCQLTVTWVSLCFENSHLHFGEAALKETSRRALSVP